MKLLIILLLATTAVFAAEHPRGWVLPEGRDDACAVEGKCVWVSRAFIERRVAEARAAALEECKVRSSSWASLR